MPPGGGFNLGALLPIALIIAFPGFFFGLFNTFFLAALILPPLLSFGFNFWKERNVIEAPCPQCGQLAAGLKGQGFTQCFVCGSQLSLRGDEWRLRSKYEDGPQAGGSKYGKVDNGVIDVEVRRRHRRCPAKVGLHGVALSAWGETPGDAAGLMMRASADGLAPSCFGLAVRPDAVSKSSHPGARPRA